MDITIKLALRYNVEIGAHPGYPDLVGFGRRSMKCSLDEIKRMVIYQTGALQALCQANDTELTYVKPHGMLNNDMMRDDDLIEAIMQAISEYNQDLDFMIVATPCWQQHNDIAKKYGINLLYEAFADRLYDDDGQLTPRVIENAVHDDPATIAEQVKHIMEGFVITRSGKEIDVHADCVCIHGDNSASIQAAPQIQELLVRI
jgi:UPF0271 protein